MLIRGVCSITYVNTSSFTLYLIPWLISRWRRRGLQNESRGQYQALLSSEPVSFTYRCGARSLAGDSVRRPLECRTTTKSSDDRDAGRNGGYRQTCGRKRRFLTSVDCPANDQPRVRVLLLLVHRQLDRQFFSGIYECRKQHRISEYEW